MILIIISAFKVFLIGCDKQWCIYYVSVYTVFADVGIFFKKSSKISHKVINVKVVVEARYAARWQNVPFEY